MAALASAASAVAGTFKCIYFGNSLKYPRRNISFTTSTSRSSKWSCAAPYFRLVRAASMASGAAIDSLKFSPCAIRKNKDGAAATKAKFPHCFRS